MMGSIVRFGWRGGIGLSAWAAAFLTAGTAHAEADPLDPVQRYELVDDAASLDISPDGATLAIGGHRMVRVVDAETIAYRQTFHVPDGRVRQVYFSPDGAILMALIDAVPDTLTALRFWHMDTGVRMELLPPEVEGIVSAAWSPDGSRLVTGHADGAARAWSLQDGALLQTFEGHEDAVRAAAFSPDGTSILTGSSDGSARLWDAATGEFILAYGGHARGVMAVAFSPGGSRVISGSREGAFHVWSAEDGAPIIQGSSAGLGMFGTADRLVVSPDGSRAFGSAGESELPGALWDLETATPSILGLDGLNVAFWPMAGVFSPDGATIVTVSLFTHRIDWWDAASGERLRTAGGHPTYFRVHQLRYAPDGSLLATGGLIDSERWSIPFYTQPREPSVRLWETATGQPKGTLHGHELGTPLALFTGEGWHVLQSHADDSILYLDAATGEELRTVGGLSHRVSAIAWPPDGAQRVLALADATLRFYNAVTGALIGIVNMSSLPSRLAYTPDGSELITNERRLWGGPAATVRSPESGQVVREIGEGLGASTALAFTPDGHHLLTASGATATLWDWKTGEKVRAFPGHEKGIIAAAISPNGRYLATGTGRQFLDVHGPRKKDHSLHIWEIESGEEVRQYTVYPVTAIAFSPNGERITAAQETSYMPAIDEWKIADLNPYLVGDVNNDGVTNAIDVQLVINAALGIELPPGLRADRNFTGLVNAVDVQLVINAALGIEQAAP